MESILLLTDFSDAAKKATKFAVEMAKSSMAKLNLLHVYEEPFSTFDNEYEVKNNNEDNRHNSRLRLKRIIDKNQLQHHPHRIYVREMNLTDAVKNISENENTDLIIMGLKEKSDIANFLGNNYFNVMAKVACPVLIIPSSAEYHPITHIVYLTDLSAEERSLSFLEQFSASIANRDINVELLHINEEGYGANHQKQKSLVEISRENMDQHLIKSDSLMGGIKKFVKMNRVDVLAITTKSTSIFQRIFSQSLTNKMMNDVSLPLLVFKAKA